MNEKNEIQIQQQPAELIMAAVKADTDLDKLEKLLELQIKWEGNEAKKAYVKAMAAFKADAPKITKDSKVDFTSAKGRTNYNYASLANVMDKINKALSEHGLSSSFTTQQNGSIGVTCKITHEMGHSEETTLSAAADQSGNKNSIQAIGSTVSYLQRYTLLSLCGLATHEQDDDAQSVGVEVIDDKQLHKLRDALISLERDEGKFCSFLKVDQLENLPKTQYQQALAAIEASKKKKEA